MDSLSFDLGGILSEEEANKLFEEQPEDGKEPGAGDNVNTETEPAEEENQPDEEPSEKVGVEGTEGNAVPPEGDGTSPNVFSSIASALKKDGIFPDFEDSELEAVKTPEDFAELFEKAISARVDADTRRVRDAMNNGLKPDVVQNYEQTIAELETYTPEAIAAEDENGENLRKYLIFNDLLKRGYSEEKARKELKKSFDAHSDLEDAQDALESLKKQFKEEYEGLQNDAKKRADEAKAAQKKQADDFKKLILEDEVKLGETKLDKKTCQRVYDAVSRPVYKDPDTGRLLTAVQKFQKEQPLEFLKQLGMWFVLTDGGKNTEGFTKEAVKAEKNKGIRELEKKLNASSLNPDGSLRYTSATGDMTDPLLSDGWKIG